MTVGVGVALGVLLTPAVYGLARLLLTGPKRLSRKPSALITLLVACMVAGAAVAVLAATTVDQAGEVIAYGLFATGVLTAAVVDVTERRIPNRVTYPLIAAGVLVLPWLSQPITGWSLIAPLLGAVASGLFGLINAIAADQGLGDVKLAIAIGAWMAHLGLICWVAGVVISQLLMIVAVATTRVRRRRAGLPPDYTPLGPSLAGGAVLAVAITGVQFS